jgi:hypothetical protein
MCKWLFHICFADCLGFVSTFRWVHPVIQAILCEHWTHHRDVPCHEQVVEPEFHCEEHISHGISDVQGWCGEILQPGFHPTVPHDLFHWIMAKYPPQQSSANYTTSMLCICVMDICDWSEVLLISQPAHDCYLLFVYLSRVFANSTALACYACVRSLCTNLINARWNVRLLM